MALYLKHCIGFIIVATGFSTIITYTIIQASRNKVFLIKAS
ncbi:hypothetical protein LLB_0383 [Legionella longbeachae D-4968]|nr:hypothetical protein LLB_0383 [Legionella longbeachae D-4968]